MVTLSPQIFTAKVMHKRLSPKKNQFTYKVYYLALPLKALKDKALNAILPINRRGMLSFHEADHPLPQGDRLNAALDSILREQGLDSLITQAQIITLPRVMGYVFNPVTFYFCFDAQGNVRAVLNEVNNTFGETHYYFAAQADHAPITGDIWLKAEKLFHVSPFLAREGHYRFNYNHKGDKLGIRIDLDSQDGTPMLITTLNGTLTPLTTRSLRAIQWRYPLIPFKTIALIHWQALKLFIKGIRYHVKPEQKQTRFSNTTEL